MLADFGQSVMLFVFIGILIVIGIYVEASIGNQIGSLSNTAIINTTGNNGSILGYVNSSAWNASVAAINATATFPQWLQIIAVVIGAAVVLGILARIFGFNLAGGQGGY